MDEQRKVTDPVCGMTFKPEKAAAIFVHEGVLYHFCTHACRDQFQQDPLRYVEANRESNDPPAGL
ncbi:MAG: YHS domain-containing protein [Gemmatimonadota bacterium]